MKQMRKLLIGLGVCGVMLVLASVFSPVDLQGALTEITTHISLRLRPSGDVGEVATDLILEIEDTSDADTLTIDGAGDVRFIETGGSTSDPDFDVDGYVNLDGTVEINGTLDLDSIMTLDTATANPFILTSTIAGASNAMKVYNTATDVTGQQYLFVGDYQDDGDADADFLIFRDNAAADTKFSISQEGDTVGNGNWTFGDAAADTITVNATLLSNLVFEGATANDFETTLSITDPTADRTVTVPNVTGKIVTSNLTNAQALEQGTGALVDGRLTVTFGTAFGAAPAAVAIARANETIYTSTAPSTTAVTFASSSGGSTTTIDWTAIGQIP